jgi:transposase
MQNFNSREMSSNVACPKFSPKKERALIELLEGAKVSEAAAKVGVNERTIQRWLKEPEFQKRLTQGRSEIYNEAMDSLREASGRAAKRIRELVDSPSEKTALKAAELAITLNLKIRDAQDQERRIRELEKEVERRYSRGQL